MLRRVAERRRQSALILTIALTSAWFAVTDALPAVAPTQRGNASKRAVVHRVLMDGTAFTPATLHVKVGERITWINEDPFPHTVTSQTGGFDSKDIASDRSWTYRATKSGNFPYRCKIGRASCRERV